MKRALAGALAALLLSCGAARTPDAAGHTGSPAPALTTPSATVVAGADDNAEPPPPGLTPDAPFPTITHRQLGNGLDLRVVERHTLPVIELRLLIRGGKASDGPKPGLAVVAGELLEAGGAGRWSSAQLVERVERLGARLSISTDRDATRLSIAVPSGELDVALELLSALVQRPRFDAAEFAKLRQREIDRVGNLSRTSGSWIASMVLYRELYELPAALHPYARYDATASELKSLTLEDCRAWYKLHVSPKNTLLVAAGDVTPDAALAAAERHFGRWQVEPTARAPHASPHPPNRTSVFVVDRPNSAQSQIYVATLGPELKTPAWPGLSAMNQILGGEFAGRLFLDVREKRALAYATGSKIEEVAHGPVPILLSAVTQTPKTAHTVAALVDHLKAIASAEPTEQEVASASRYLADSFLIASASVGALADLTARLGVLELANDWYDDYRRDVGTVEPAHVHRLAGRYLQPDRALIVVSGAADRIAEPLRRFGPVTVVDPERAFATRRNLTHDPSVALDASAPRP